MSGPLPGVGSPLFAAADRHAWAAVLLAREEPAAVSALLDGLTRDELAMLALRLACSLSLGPASSEALRHALLAEAAS